MTYDTEYKALVADRQDDGELSLSVQTRHTRDLPKHDVLIRVDYSSLNYKDALSASGNRGVTSSYPHTPGIDASGVVKKSRDPRFSEGDEVIVTSYDLGQNTPGGFGRYISVPGDWVVPLPPGLSMKDSMILGTAGFTAAYGIKKIVESGISPDDGEIVVTGATGGVGSLSVCLLSHLGYSVAAVTGKKEKRDFLKTLGAELILERGDITEVPGKPLLSARWPGAIDTVGGAMLDAVLRQTAHNGAVACCGNILGGTLQTSIYPFILRGISLLGVDSGNCLMKDRKEVWNLLAGSWHPGSDSLGEMSRQRRLSDLPDEVDAMLTGNQYGRVVIALRD